MLLLGSFSVKAWNGVTAVPGGSPLAPPPRVFVDPKLPKPVPVVVVLEPPPKRDEPVFAVPKPPAGLLAFPNRPPPVVLLPKAEGVAVVLVFDPKPPKPVPVLLGVLEAPKRPPEAGVVVAVDPKAGLLPKPPVLDPNPPSLPWLVSGN